jgi:hypothetical protein
MLSLSLKTDRPDEYQGMLNVSVEYEGRLKTRIKCNDHFDLSPTVKPELGSAQFFTTLLQNEFSKSIERTVSITSGVFQNFLTSEKFDNGNH